jgi:transposase-like protein
MVLRFPGEIISHAIWLYFRFPLSHRNVEELLFVRRVFRKSTDRKHDPVVLKKSVDSNRLKSIGSFHIRRDVVVLA